jgi:hypothetical protein
MKLSFSEKELIKAKKYLDEMKAKEDKNLLMEFKSNWLNFLIYLERVWNKSEEEYTKFPNFQPWQGKYIRERKKDSLLKYLKHARDTDQHSIQPITTEKGYEVEIISPSNRFTFKEGESIRIEVDLKEPRIENESFINRDGHYEPPIEHLGKKISNPNDPIEIAELGFQYYEEYLKEIQAKFN